MALSTLLAAADASAQMSGSVAFVSDYLFRGVSLSDGRPVMQFNLTYDDASGWYGGAFASGARSVSDPGTHVQLIGYAGHARRLGGGLSFDAGASYAAFPGLAGYDYAEVHAAFATTDAMVQLSYSPNYFDRSVPTAYLEINASLPRGRLPTPFIHVGVLRTLSERSGYGQRTHVDGRIGVGLDIGRAALQLSWGSSNRVTAVYERGVEQDRRPAWVLRLAGSF